MSASSLRLKLWEISYARENLPELKEPRPTFACWVGSVSVDDELRFSEFTSKARQGDVRGMTQFQQIGGNLAYAILLNLGEKKWKLVIVESPEDPASKERSIFASMIQLKESVEVYRAEMTKAEEQLKTDCNLRFRDILKQWLRF